MERNRKDRNGGVLDTVAELFDLPADLVAGLPHLEMMAAASCIWSTTQASWRTATSRST